jgi:hypothetical protein
MTEQHILNELYRAQADLEKAQALVYAYQDVVQAASRMLRHIDAQNKIAPTSGGTYGLAVTNLRLALAFILKPNGDPE